MLPNVITAFGLSCGLFVIYKVHLINDSKNVFEMLLTSSFLLLIAALADVLDGAIARAMKKESEFGFMFDSLADAVSFGVAPSVLLLKGLSLNDYTGLTFFALACAMIYSICGILRLVRFNVKTHQIQGDIKAMESYKKSFSGLPIPAGAACSLSINLFLHSPNARLWFGFSNLTTTLIAGLCSLVAGVMMISNVKFPSLKTLKVRVSSFFLLFVTVIAALFVLYGIIHHFSLVFLVISWVYFFIGCLLTLIRIIAGKRVKTLKDFDPNDEK